MTEGQDVMLSENHFIDTFVSLHKSCYNALSSVYSHKTTGGRWRDFKIIDRPIFECKAYSAPFVWSCFRYKYTKKAKAPELWLFISTFTTDGFGWFRTFQSACTTAQKRPEWVWPLTTVVTWILSANLMYQNELLSVTGNCKRRFPIFPTSVN
jgi:hypothetical protein